LQLNHNTLDLASTVGDLQTQQVLYNLSLIYDNEGAIPTHVDITAGSASTSNSLTPNVGTPINSATGAVNQVTTTIANATTIATQAQRTSSRASSTTGLSASDSWTQSWNYNPVIDGDELRRLRSLYRYALAQLTDKIFTNEYPLVQKSQTLTYAAGNGPSAPPINDELYCPDIGLKSGTGPNAHPVGCTSVTTTIQIPDERYLHKPGCILCLRDYKLYTNGSKPTVNSRLQKLNGGWLLTEQNELPPNPIYLGHYGHHDLYIREQDLWKLSDFTLFVLTATAQSAAASPSAAGSAAKKTPNNFFIDQFGNTFIQQ
jgi:hypothetical protein